MRNFILLSSAFIIALFIAGCNAVPSSQMEGPSYGERVSTDDIRYSGIRMNAVAIIDRNLQKHFIKRDFQDQLHKRTVGKIAIEASGSKYNETGTMKVWATIRNRANHDIQVECRASFFDEDKMHVEGPSGWNRVVINANSIESCKENSLSFDNIKYYYIEIREGR